MILIIKLAGKNSWPIFYKYSISLNNRINQTMGLKLGFIDFADYRHEEI